MNDDLERRIQDAVTAHGRTVRPDDAGSLDAIRARAASARKRRLIGASAVAAAAALIIGVAIGVSVGDDGGDQTITAGGGSTTLVPPTTDCPSVTTGPTITTTTYATTTAPGSSSTVVAGGVLGGSVPVTTVGPRTDTVVEEAEPVGCGDIGTTTTTDPPTTPTVPSTTTTTAPRNPPFEVLFPYVGSIPPNEPWPWADAKATAKAFLDQIGVDDDPGLGDFVADGSAAGSIAVHPRDGSGAVRTDIVRSTVSLQEFDGHWYVVGATSESVDLRSAEMTGPHTLTVSGYGRGFEATLHVQVIGHDGPFRRDAVTMAGGDMELRPFTSEIDLTDWSGQVATIVVANESGETGGPSEFAAISFKVPSAHR